MVNVLSSAAVAGKSFPYTWTITGDSSDGEYNSSVSDGYKVTATLAYLQQDLQVAQTTGACVEALTASGE